MNTTIASVLAKFPAKTDKRTPLTTWIKRILTMEFPGVKFSVTCDHGSVNVRWADGPSDKEVDSIVNLFEEGHFDGMTDMYEYYEKDNEWRKAFGGARYVFTHRDVNEAYEVVKRSLISHGVPDDSTHHGAQSTAYRMISNTTIPNGARVIGVAHRDNVRVGMMEDFYHIVTVNK